MQQFLRNICNFFVNKNKATYEDMKKLIDFVKENVKEKTGVNLDLEIEISRNKNYEKNFNFGGGFSKERAISLITAKSVFKALKKKKL